MHIKSAALVAAVTLAIFALQPALADEPPGGSAPQSATYLPPSAGNPDEVICRDIKALGSRVQSKKVCMTRQDWEIQERNARETTQEWQRHGAPQQGH